LSSYPDGLPIRFDTWVKRLDEWEEVVGVVLSVDRAVGMVSFRGLKVVVPPRELACIPDFESYLGRRITLLRTDLTNRPLCIRFADSTTKLQPASNPETQSEKSILEGSLN